TLNCFKDGANLLHAAQPGRVEDVRAGLLVGKQSFDRVVEILAFAEVVLRARSDDHMNRPAVRRVGRRRDAFRRQADVVDLAPPPVLHRAPGHSGLERELYRLSDSGGVVSETVLEIAVHRKAGCLGDRTGMSYRLLPAHLAVESTQ